MCTVGDGERGWVGVCMCCTNERAQADLEVHTLLALQDTNELTGNDATLVDELVERVLPIGAGLAKVHLT